MIRLLRDRESGLSRPDAVKQSEQTRRTMMLELSSFTEVEKINSAVVNCLDLEQVESRYLISAYGNGCICIFDVLHQSDDPKALYRHVCQVDAAHKSRHKYSCECVQWYPPDTGVFVSTGMDYILKVWDAELLTVAEEINFSSEIHDHHMSSVALEHSLVAVALNMGHVKLFDMRCGSSTHSLRSHKSRVNTVRWSNRDSYLLASGGRDNRVLLWDIRAAKSYLKSLDQHNGNWKRQEVSAGVSAHSASVTSIQFCPDGMRLMTFGTDNCLRLWSAVDGQNQLINYGIIDNDATKCIRMSIGHFSNPALALVPTDADIGIYNVDSGDELCCLRGHYCQVNCCTFDDRMQRLFSGSNDKNILVWEPEVESSTNFMEFLKSGEGLEHKSIEAPKSILKRTAIEQDAWSSDSDAD